MQQRPPWWLWPLLAVLLPVIAVGVVLWLTAAIVLQLIVWTTWCPRGRYALVVYSNSPIWKDYFEQRLLPAIGNRAVVLNWSERRQWSYALPAALFTCFGGRREFNPLAVAFAPLASPVPFLSTVPGLQARPPRGSRGPVAKPLRRAGRVRTSGKERARLTIAARSESLDRTT